MSPLTWRLHQYRVAKAMLVLMVLATALPVVSRATIHVRGTAESGTWVELCGSAGIHRVRLEWLVSQAAEAASSSASAGLRPDHPASTDVNTESRTDWLDACPMCTLPIDRMVPVDPIRPAPVLLQGVKLAELAIQASGSAVPEVSRARGPPLISV